MSGKSPRAHELTAAAVVSFSYINVSQGSDEVLSDTEPSLQINIGAVDGAQSQ